MRASPRSDTTAIASIHHHARAVGRAFAVVFAAIALLWLMVVITADNAAAQRGGFSRGGGGMGFGRGGGGMGFGRGGGAGIGRGSFGGGRTQSAPRMGGGGRGMRTPAGMGRSQGAGRNYGSRRTAGPGRVGRGGRDAGRSARPGSRTSGRRTAGDRRQGRYPGKREAGRKPGGKQSPGHYRSGSRGDGKTHARAGSAGGKHDRRASSGTNHQRVASSGHYRSASAGSGDRHNRRASYGGNEGHNRRASSGGEGHRRYASHDRRASGGGEAHYRYGSHDRRFSMGRAPLYTPPVPPVVTYDPPPGPPAPPAAGGGGGGGGGASPPPRAMPPVGGQPPVRVSRVFGGVPPSGEDRYVPDEIICVLRDDLTEDEIDQFLVDNRLERTANGRIQMGLIGVQVFRYRITDGRPVPQVVAELQNDPRGVSVQPNYIYQLADSSIRAQAAPMVRTSSGLARPSAYSSMQYAVTKLRLRQAHQHSRGERVLVAVIDSGVDSDHPEIAGSVVGQIDVTDADDDRPDKHGTAMTGIIVSQSQLLGVAPHARVIAIRVFAPRGRVGTHGTSFHIAMAIDRAAQEGARVVNLSLAGPNDPYVHKAVKEARSRGIVLVAAAGNAGPTSPPLYPAAYPEVIAVTATDRQDRIYTRANRGPHVLVAAPGVEVMVALPGGAYGIDNGTSVATAHVSGIVALMLARNPMLDPDTVRELLVRSVRRVADGGPPDDYGAGHADAYEAVVAVGPGESGPPVATGPVPVPMPARYEPTPQ